MPTNLYGPRDNYHLNNSHVMAAMIRRFITAKNNEVDEVVCWEVVNLLESSYMLMIFQMLAYFF